jgi:hypothetical protein
MSAPQPGDKSAAFTGLILGSIALFVLMFAVVRITNARFAGHGGAHAAPAAAQGAAATPAATAAPAAATPAAH